MEFLPKKMWEAFEHVAEDDKSCSHRRRPTDIDGEILFSELSPEGIRLWS